MTYLDEAKKVINNEISGIKEVEKKLDSSFNTLINTLSNLNGRIVMCGMGKSGHIAKKIFSTLVSTGTPSLFMHPAEAFHGDLGMILPEDVFFAISNSGETSEVTQLLPFIKHNNNLLISMTGNPKSTIASLSDFHIDIGVTKEACPLNLAPTTSTTVSLILGDAIAIALMRAKGFSEENFARYHPGGALGKKLLFTVKEYLQEASFIDENSTFIEVISALSVSRTGLVLVGCNSILKGIITDGDIRKYLCNNESEIFKAKAYEIMSLNPKTISSNTRCSDADSRMNSIGVNSLVVIDGDKVIGIYANLNRKNK